MIRLGDLKSVQRAFIRKLPGLDRISSGRTRQKALAKPEVCNMQADGHHLRPASLTADPIG